MMALNCSRFLNENERGMHKQQSSTNDHHRFASSLWSCRWIWVFMPCFGCHSGIGFVGQGFRNPPKLVDCWFSYDLIHSCQHSNCPWRIARIFNKIYLNFVTLLHWETKGSYLFDYELGKRNANCAPLCCSRPFPKLLSQLDFLIFKTLSTSLDQQVASRVSCWLRQVMIQKIFPDFPWLQTWKEKAHQEGTHYRKPSSTTENF